MEIFYISGEGDPEKNSYIFSEKSFFIYRGKGNPKKILCVSGNRNLKKLLYFRKYLYQLENQKSLMFFLIKKQNNLD